MTTKTNTEKKTTADQSYRAALDEALLDCHIGAQVVSELIETKIKYVDDETRDWGRVGSLKHVAELLSELETTLESMS